MQQRFRPRGKSTSLRASARFGKGLCNYLQWILINDVTDSSLMNQSDLMPVRFKYVLQLVHPRETFHSIISKPCDSTCRTL
jgi:hypothetical protein